MTLFSSIVLFLLLFSHSFAYCGDLIRDAYDEECDGGDYCLEDCTCTEGYSPPNKTTIYCVPDCAISGCEDGCSTPDECSICTGDGYRSDCLACADGYIPQTYLTCVEFNQSSVVSCNDSLTKTSYYVDMDNVEPQEITLNMSDIQMGINTCSKRLLLQQPYAPGFWIQFVSDSDQYIAIEANEHYEQVTLDFYDMQQNSIGVDTVFVVSTNCPSSTSVDDTERLSCYLDSDNISEFVKLSRVVFKAVADTDYFLFVHKPFGDLFYTVDSDGVTTYDDVTIKFTPIVHPCSYTYTTINWPEIATSGYVAVVNTAFSVRSSSACIESEQIGSWFHLVGADRTVIISTCDSATDYSTAIHLVRIDKVDSIDTSIDCSYNSADCARYDVSGCSQAGSHHSSMMVDLSSDYDYFIFASVVTENNAAFNLSINTLCPYDCGGHGVCDKVSQTCICNEGYVLLTDSCSQCGNGVLDDGEECESLEGDSYEDPNCDYSTCSCRDGYVPVVIDGVSHCAVETCGNGEVDDYEECDGGKGCQHCVCTDGYVSYAKARVDCLSSKCGNKVLDDDEECDGGEGCVECECQEDYFDGNAVGCSVLRQRVISEIIIGAGILLWIFFWLVTFTGFFSKYIYLNRMIDAERQKDERLLIESTIIKFNKEGSQYIDAKETNPLFSFESTSISFPECSNHVEVDEDTRTVIRITNKKSEPMRFIFHGGEYPKYTISFNPAIQSVRPGGTAEIICNINVNCTCVLKEKIPVTIRYGRFKQIMQELIEENPQLLDVQSQSSQNSELSEVSKNSGSKTSSTNKTGPSKSATLPQSSSGKKDGKGSDKRNKAKNINKFYVYLDLNIESALSTKIDYEEVNLIHPPIGSGTFGIVYRADWRGVDVAVKVMKTDLVDMKDLLPNFMQEASMMERIRCQYVVNYIGSVVTPDTLCLITEFCHLGSLRKYMKTNALSNHLKIRFCQDVARGMEYLHNNDIVHRDLKTDNVLVVSKNPFDPVTAKVTDFGTSRSFIESSHKLGIQHIGTPVYMAPEMTLQKDEISEQMTLKSDVYSFAICMLEVWLTHDPYDSVKFPDSESILKFVGNGKRLDIPTDCIFKDCIKKCWKQVAAERPSFQEVASSLGKLYKIYIDSTQQGTDTDQQLTNSDDKRASKDIRNIPVEDQQPNPVSSSDVPVHESKETSHSMSSFSRLGSSTNSNHSSVASNKSAKSNKSKSSTTSSSSSSDEEENN
ncbi:Serine-threonine protein kinase [Entamoeba marina]